MKWQTGLPSGRGEEDGGVVEFEVNLSLSYLICTVIFFFDLAAGNRAFPSEKSERYNHFQVLVQPFSYPSLPLLTIRAETVHVQ